VATDQDLHPTNGLADLFAFCGWINSVWLEPIGNAAPFASRQGDLGFDVTAEPVADRNILMARISDYWEGDEPEPNGGGQGRNK
jgi:hypothetical protein